MSPGRSPSQREYLLNMESKMHDDDFLGDTTALLRPEVSYDHFEAYHLVRKVIIEQI